MILIILLTMDITYEYDEYYLMFEQESLHFLSGFKAVFVKKLIRNIKIKYKLTKLYSYGLFLSASNIFSYTLRCCCSATKLHCR